MPRTITFNGVTYIINDQVAFQLENWLRSNAVILDSRVNEQVRDQGKTLLQG